MLAIIGASGKLGFATLTSLVERKLLPTSSILVTSSSSSGAAKLSPYTDAGAQLRRVDFDADVAAWAAALNGCDRILLVSSARVEEDFHDAAPGQGRERDHFRVLEGARAAGVRHVYYTSLAFGNPSRSRVMKAHERTEEWLAAQTEMQVTVLREGLYNESWPLYLGHWEMEKDATEREEVVVAGDGAVSWTSIDDLGLATAMVLAAPTEEWSGKTLYLAQKKAYSLREVAAMVARARGKEVQVKIVSRPEHEEFYVRERGMDEAFVKWWSKTYDALNENECEMDDPTLERLLASKGVVPTPMEETVASMFSKST
nr:quinone oxidoreductase 2 [Quercus suber]